MSLSLVVVVVAVVVIDTPPSESPVYNAGSDHVDVVEDGNLESVRK